MIDKSKVKNILVITLSNIGDVILTTPVITALTGQFKGARLDVMVGPRAKELFEKDKRLNRLIIYDKYASMADKKNLTRSLRQNRYDLVVDFRNTIFGWFLMPRYRTRVFESLPKHIHRRQMHAFRLKRLGIDIDYKTPSVWVDEADKAYIKDKITKFAGGKKIVVICPGAKSHIKRWNEEGFLFVAQKLMDECGAFIVLAGDESDRKITSSIAKGLKGAFIDMAGQTSIGQLSALISMAGLVISNDSAPMHLACALNRPVVAIFGPTDPDIYGPTGEYDVMVNKNLTCVPCMKAQCRFNHECMKMIDKEYVFQKAKEILEGKRETRTENREPKLKRILIIRTDRIGDVLLSTPVIECMRKAYPNAYIAFMTRHYDFDIVNGNPYLDEVIIYDKFKEHRGPVATFKFAMKLREKKFDIAVILHPTNRVNWVAFLAGIPVRLGFNKKCGYLLTHPLADKKAEGKKHEIEYTLDVIRSIGVDAKFTGLYMPIKNESEKAVINFLDKNGIKRGDLVIGIHPGASCPSKIWPVEYFAQLCDMIADNIKGAKIVVICAHNQIGIAQRLHGLTKNKPILAAGNFSVSEIASLLKRSSVFISNDSGPVHISVAVATPVISIFGRNEAGLSPARWAPVGKDDIVMHKEVGCKVCLAHNCKIGFKCLKSITPPQVFEAAKLLIDRVGVVC